MSEILKPPKEIQNQIIVLQKTIDDIKGKIEELNERIKKAKESVEILEEKGQKTENRNDEVMSIDKKFPKIFKIAVNAVALTIMFYGLFHSTDYKTIDLYLENIKHSQTALDILTKQLKERELELKTLQK